MLFKVLLIVQLMISFLLIGSVMLQHGKGADAGASFGGGSSNAVFGATGGATFLSRLTSILAVAFFVLGLVLATLAIENGGVKHQSVVAEPVVTDNAQPASPVVPE